VIVADGQVTAEEETEQAIVSASHHPISIVVIGTYTSYNNQQSGILIFCYASL